MSKKVYLAAQYGWRDTLKWYAKQLAALGVEVTSTWLNERKDPKSELTELNTRFLKDHAIVDVVDIKRADAIVLFTVKPTDTTKRGGRHVEFGIAYALGKELIICGPYENIFHYLPEVKQFDNFGDVLEYFAGEQK